VPDVDFGLFPLLVGRRIDGESGLESTTFDESNVGMTICAGRPLRLEEGVLVTSYSKELFGLDLIGEDRPVADVAVDLRFSEVLSLSGKGVAPRLTLSSTILCPT